MKKKIIIALLLTIIILGINFYTNYCLKYSNKLLVFYKENRKLAEKVENIEQLTIEIQNNERILTFLEKEKKFQQSLAQKETIVSSVIQRDILSWNDTLWIDKGQEEGLKIGMVVLSQCGLIGRISTVKKDSSKVDLITSTEKYTRNTFSVRIQNNTENVLGLLGTYNAELNELDLSEVLDSTQIRKQDTVVTNGRTFSELPVGIVKRIESSEPFLTKKVSVEPYVDFDDILFVTVIKK